MCHADLMQELLNFEHCQKVYNTFAILKIGSGRTIHHVQNFLHTEKILGMLNTALQEIADFVLCKADDTVLALPVISHPDTSTIKVSIFSLIRHNILHMMAL